MSSEASSGTPAAPMSNGEKEVDPEYAAAFERQKHRELEEAKFRCSIENPAEQPARPTYFLPSFLNSNLCRRNVNYLSARCNSVAVYQASVCNLDLHVHLDCPMLRRTTNVWIY